MRSFTSCSPLVLPWRCPEASNACLSPEIIDCPESRPLLLTVLVDCSETCYVFVQINICACFDFDYISTCLNVCITCSVYTHILEYPREDLRKGSARLCSGAYKIFLCFRFCSCCLNSADQHRVNLVQLMLKGSRLFISRIHSHPALRVHINFSTLDALFADEE